MVIMRPVFLYRTLRLLEMYSGVNMVMKSCWTVCKICSNVSTSRIGLFHSLNCQWLLFIMFISFSCDQGNLSSVAIKSSLLCQILRGAISSNSDAPEFNLTSFPTMFVTNWIKSIFKIMDTITRDLSKYLFTRNPNSTNVSAVSNDVFDNVVRFSFRDYCLIFCFNFYL